MLTIACNFLNEIIEILLYIFTSFLLPDCLSEFTCNLKSAITPKQKTSNHCSKNSLAHRAVWGRLELPCLVKSVRLAFCYTEMLSIWRICFAAIILLTALLCFVHITVRFRRVSPAGTLKQIISTHTCLQAMKLSCLCTR